MNSALFYTIHESTIGNLLVVASARGVRLITLLSENESPQSRLEKEFGAQVTDLVEDADFFPAMIEAIDNYLAHGWLLKLPVDMKEGTALQRSVWNEIAKIPHGETITYSELAERVGFPRAVRAVASACGANPVPLIIPCHRVLAKDGTLGGFSLGGLDTKEYLLLIESQKQQARAAA